MPGKVEFQVALLQVLADRDGAASCQGGWGLKVSESPTGSDQTSLSQGLREEGEKLEEWEWTARAGE